jgi:hypothetical protein
MTDFPLHGAKALSINKYPEFVEKYAREVQSSTWQCIFQYLLPFVAEFREPLTRAREGKHSEDLSPIPGAAK